MAPIRRAAPALHIRSRADGDLEECVRLLRVVHEVDGYPTHWPRDPAAWLSPSAMLGSWVADDEGRIVGHVALRDARAAGWSSATGLPLEQFVAITRLFVSPDARNTGIGGGLLDEACAEASARGLRSVIDVVDTDREAIRFYERRGWRRVSSEPWDRAEDGGTLLHYYVAPSGKT